jgi:hypothetical protein
MKNRKYKIEPIVNQYYIHKAWKRIFIYKGEYHYLISSDKIYTLHDPKDNRSITAETYEQLCDLFIKINKNTYNLLYFNDKF